MGDNLGLQNAMYHTSWAVGVLVVGMVGTFIPSQVSHAVLIEALPPYPVIDQDMLSRGNWALIQQKPIRYTYYEVTTGTQTYRLGKFSHPAPNPVPTYVVLHDAEDAAFDSGLHQVAHQGGTLWVLENQEKRNLFDSASNTLTNTDPNRMFWGLDQTETTANATAEFAMYLLTQLGIKAGTTAPHPVANHATPTLVALHNNRPNGNFGLDYIEAFGNTQTLCQRDPESKNLYWLTLSANAATDSAVNQRSLHLAQALCETDKVNVVTEAAPSVAEGDGSLSVYMVNKAPNWQYVNIEIKAAKPTDPHDIARAKHAQLGYIERLQQLIDSQPR